MAVQEVVSDRPVTKPASLALLYHPLVRGIALQVVVGLAIVVLVVWMVDNTIDNLRRANIASGFGFLRNRAGFDIAQSLVSYTPESSYGRALVVGLLNTLLVAALGIVFAS